MQKTCQHCCALVLTYGTVCSADVRAVQAAYLKSKTGACTPESAANNGCCNHGCFAGTILSGCSSGQMSTRQPWYRFNNSLADKNLQSLAPCYCIIITSLLLHMSNKIVASDTAVLAQHIEEAELHIPMTKQPFHGQVFTNPGPDRLTIPCAATAQVRHSLWQLA